MNTDGRRFCFKSPASASQRHHPSHHSSSCFIILKRIMIYQKNMIHSSHYSRFWNKQHIGWQDILRKRNGAQLRPASLPCRGAVVHHDYHLPTPFSHRSVSLGQTQRRWKYPRCGCVCVKEPWLSFYTMALQLLQFMGAGLNQPETWSLSMFWQGTLPQCPNCLLEVFFNVFSIDLSYLFHHVLTVFFSWFPKLLGTTTHVT